MRTEYIDNQAVIAARLAAVADPAERTVLTKVLRYLYLSAEVLEAGRLGSALNINTRSQQLAEPYLNDGEIIMSYWLALRQ